MQNIEKITAADAAKYLLFLALKKDYGDTISNLKMQKLLYYAQGWHLAIYDEPLFNDKIEAWSYGPVVRNAYNKFKKYGKNSINFNELLDFDTGKIDQNKEAMELLIMIYRKYGSMSAGELVNSTHNEAPWLDAYSNDNKEITKEAMRLFFDKQIQNEASAALKEVKAGQWL